MCCYKWYSLVFYIILNGLVTPSPTYGASGLPQAFLFEKQRVFWKTPILINSNQYLMLVTIFANTKQTRNAIPCRKMVGFRPELSPRPDWWPKRCPTIVHILFMIGISRTVPSYCTAYVSTVRYCVRIHLSTTIYIYIRMCVYITYIQNMCIYILRRHRCHTRCKMYPRACVAWWIICGY